MHSLEYLCCIAAWVADMTPSAFKETSSIRPRQRKLSPAVTTAYIVSTDVVIKHLDRYPRHQARTHRLILMKL